MSGGGGEKEIKIGGLFQFDAAPDAVHRGSGWRVHQPGGGVAEVREGLHRSSWADQPCPRVEGLHLQGPDRAPAGQHHVPGTSERPLQGSSQIPGFLLSRPELWVQVLPVCFRRTNWMGPFTKRSGPSKPFGRLPRSLWRPIQTSSGHVSSSLCTGTSFTHPALRNATNTKKNHWSTVKYAYLS